MTSLSVPSVNLLCGASRVISRLKVAGKRCDVKTRITTHHDVRRSCQKKWSCARRTLALATASPCHPRRVSSLGCRPRRDPPHQLVNYHLLRLWVPLVPRTVLLSKHRCPTSVESRPERTLVHAGTAFDKRPCSEQRSARFFQHLPPSITDYKKAKMVWNKVVTLTRMTGWRRHEQVRPCVVVSTEAQKSGVLHRSEDSTDHPSKYNV